MLNLTLFLNQCIISDSFNSEVFVQCRINVLLVFNFSQCEATCLRQDCFVDLPANL